MILKLIQKRLRTNYIMFYEHDQKNATGRFISMEVEADIFKVFVMQELFINTTLPGLSGMPFGRNNKEGELYQSSMVGLTDKLQNPQIEFDHQKYKTAILNFKKGSKNNERSIYKDYFVKVPAQPLIIRFYHPQRANFGM